jgi:hypothetical protein
MFLVRSAFWLTAAYLVIHPGNVDLGATASAMSGQAMAAGQAIVIRQILNNDCSLPKCASAAQMVALTASVRNPSVDLTMQDSSAISLAPIPRSRPGWMG